MRIVNNFHLACDTYSHDGKTPLLCAAEAGHDEIVAYLLQFRKVQNDPQNHKKEVHSSRVSYN